MPNEDLFVQTLVKLGLTTPQARVYLATLALQNANVTKISALSKVARPDVYRVLPALEEKGVVKKIIASPTTYEAIPVKQVCDMLLQRKKDEYSIIQKDTVTLVYNF